MPDNNPQDENNEEQQQEESIEKATIGDEEESKDEEKQENGEQEESNEDGENKTEKEDDEVLNPDDVDVEVRTTDKKEEGEEEDDTDPEDRSIIDKRVQRETAPIKEELQRQRDTNEVDGFIRDNPEFGKYRKVALKYMANSSYGNIPAHNIMAIVSSRDQQKLGARRERIADKKARDTQSGGSSGRKGGVGAKDWSKASPEEIQAQKNKIYERDI